MWVALLVRMVLRVACALRGSWGLFCALKNSYLPQETKNSLLWRILFSKYVICSFVIILYMFALKVAHLTEFYDAAACSAW